MKQKTHSTYRCGIVVAPSRGRGLKPIRRVDWQIVKGRPFTGAWIETTYFSIRAPPSKVAPSRGRGLKLSCMAAGF